MARFEQKNRGPPTMLPCVWCMVYGVWCMVYGVWCMVYGVWCMVYGVWFHYPFRLEKVQLFQIHMHSVFGEGTFAKG
jgi:hypothetical protein